VGDGDMSYIYQIPILVSADAYIETHPVWHNYYVKVVFDGVICDGEHFVYNDIDYYFK
jgi:hypothetical protein